MSAKTDRRNMLDDAIVGVMKFQSADYAVEESPNITALLEDVDIATAHMILTLCGQPALWNDPDLSLDWLLANGDEFVKSGTDTFRAKK